MKMNDPIDDQILVVVILGVKPDSYGNATKQMINRALTGVRFLKKYPGSLCVVSGGKTSGFNISEALLLQDILLANGINKKKIILEEQSSNTIENVLFSIKKLKQKFGDMRFSVIVCTEKYHSFRAKLLFKINGFSVRPAIPRKL